MIPGGGGGDTDDSVSLEEPDSDRFLGEGGVGIDFREIFAFSVTFVLLYVTELVSAFLEAGFGAWRSTSSFFYGIIDRLTFGPLEVLSGAMTASFEAAATDISSMEILGFVAGVLLVAVWFFALERAVAVVRGWI